jgi:hypothetical protein
MGSVLLSYGMRLGYDKYSPNEANSLRFGAYLGIAVMILYTGRRYYSSVAAAAVGLPSRLPRQSIMASAGRGLVVCLLAGVGIVTLSGLSWPLATAVVACSLLVWVVLARVLCETGLFFISGPYLPVAAIVGLLGFEAVGPTGFILLGLAGFMLVGDPRTALMPYLSTALKLAEPADDPTSGGSGLSQESGPVIADRRSPRRVVPWLVLMMIGGFIVAGIATMSITFEHGVNPRDPAGRQHFPNTPFNRLMPLVDDARAQGTLDAAVQTQGLARLGLIEPVDGVLLWTAIGLGLVLVCAAGRLRLSWWPLHPLIFVVWGTWAMSHFAFSFLVGWAVRTAVVRLGGVKSFESVKPLMVGLIAGELLLALLWMSVGAWYYLQTGQEPQIYRVFP